jgi:formiminotetrahydrofolate cyclodeaminase
VNDKKKL